VIKDNKLRTTALALVVCLTGLAVAGSRAQAQSAHAGTAAGTLTVDGKPIPLKYAYVVDVDNVEEAGLLIGGPRKVTVIVLSDRSLPLSSVNDRNSPYSERLSPAQYFAPSAASPANKIYGIVLKLEPGKANPLGAQFLYPGGDSLSFTVAGTEYPDRVTGLKRVGGILSGAAMVAAPQQTHLDKGPKKYQYKAEFRAPILTEIPVKQTIEGKEALDSPPVLALKAYMTAGKAGDIATVRKLTAASHQTYLSNKEFLESLKSFEVDKIPEQVKRVVIRGNTAAIVVVSEKPSYSQTMMHLVNDKGEWKMYWP